MIFFYISELELGLPVGPGAPTYYEFAAAG